MLRCSVNHFIRSEAALFSNQAFVGAFDVVSRRPTLRAVLRAARLGPRAGSPATRSRTEIDPRSARLRRLRARDSVAGEWRSRRLLLQREQAGLVLAHLCAF